MNASMQQIATTNHQLKKSTQSNFVGLDLENSTRRKSIVAMTVEPINQLWVPRLRPEPTPDRERLERYQPQCVSEFDGSVTKGRRLQPELKSGVIVGRHRAEKTPA